MSDPPLPVQQQTFKYAVFAGNYPQFLRDALAKRGNWVEKDVTVDTFHDLDFVWKPFNF